MLVTVKKPDGSVIEKEIRYAPKKPAYGVGSIASHVAEKETGMGRIFKAMEAKK